MKKIVLCMSLIALFGLTLGYGQKRSKKKKSDKTTSSVIQEQSNAFAPVEKNEATKYKKSSAKKRQMATSKYHQLSYEKKIEEFEERMQANVKRYKKMQKEMKKPQYSDPSYFGHKRKPKKRALNKRKFCKECGIVH